MSVLINHKEDQISGDGHYRNGKALFEAGYLLRVWNVNSAAKFDRAVENSLATFIAMDYPGRFSHYYHNRTEGGHAMHLLGPIQTTLDVMILQDASQDLSNSPPESLLAVLSLPLM